MTSVFYDVIRFESVRGCSNVLIEGHFLTVFGEFEPQNVVGHRVDPKRHFLTSQRVFWDISREIPCTGCFSRRVRGIKIKKRPYISRISPGAPLRPIGTNFGLRVRLVDVINCAKFYRNRLGVRILWVVKVWPFHRNAMSPLTLLELTLPLWSLCYYI